MQPIVELRNLSKSFDGRKANSGISLKVQKGSIHAILGENGAGKTTAMKILYGIFEPDEGEIFIDGNLWGGKKRPWSSPSDAISFGIGMVHQHFMLASSHTALENIFLGVETFTSKWKLLPRALRPIDRDAAQKKLNFLSEKYGLKVEWNIKISELSVGVQQRIEILKLLYRDARILILDEPTAVLTPQETQELFKNLRKLCSEGKSILIITHKLKEVMDLADRVSVFRGGGVVAEREIKETSIEELASLIVGHSVSLIQKKILPQSVLKEPVIELVDICMEGRQKLQHFNLTLRGGEIVGICGVEGNGQSELVELLLHSKENASRIKGYFRILGEDGLKTTTAQLKKKGMAVIPDDRHRDAVLLNRPVYENFLLGFHKRSFFTKGGFLLQKKIEEKTRFMMEKYAIWPPSIKIKCSALSGGNQQKLVIAREFQDSPRFLLAVQPTRGVDIGAVDFIHKKILDIRAKGNGVLLISSELEEILALSDRILILFEGKILDELKQQDVSEKLLGLRIGGATHA